MGSKTSKDNGHHISLKVSGSIDTNGKDRRRYRRDKGDKSVSKHTKFEVLREIHFGEITRQLNI